VPLAFILFYSVPSSMTAVSRFDTRTLKLGSALHIRHRHPLFVMFRYLYLLLIPAGLILLYLGDRTFGTLCILMGPILFIRKVFWQYRLLQNTKNSPHANEELHWTFDENGFHHKSKIHASETSWAKIMDRFLAPEGILLYLSREQYFVLPRGVFENDADFQAVTALIQEKVPSTK